MDRCLAAVTPSDRARGDSGRSSVGGKLGQGDWAMRDVLPPIRALFRFAAVTNKRTGGEHAAECN
jgi:hypothetical protein